MHVLQTLPLLALTATLALSAALLPTIHVGTIQTCGTNKYGPDYIAWLDDQSPCDGTDLGIVNSYRGHGLCDLTAPIPDHPELMFSGCAERVQPFGQAGLPSGVMENGNQVMECHEAGGQETACPSPCGQGQTVMAASNVTCSPIQRY
ncbi:hypothetical protein BO71DRAFT_399984 [Aspergillus ellipticus CBS 707.79]|uniref:Uncharacterized protein n=1 Tax=Aspergillus ellipticus CBS 707.79 TaxID=1448320 RepID=A0A319D6R1_9EURO|nr:hypothetical protein BO71DRAFT_399984 [Aspergillus ellipticus CBS 707.79]